MKNAEKEKIITNTSDLKKQNKYIPKTNLVEDLKEYIDN